LCFDDRREIDVSGVAKVAELDGVDDSFFELNEIDLRNIDSEISNPPPIPKKGKSSVLKPKGKVCRRLDFEQVMKPETYRCFEISGRSMRGKVDEFYKMCDDYSNEKSKNPY
jgi:hypothetical protein